MPRRATAKKTAKKTSKAVRSARGPYKAKNKVAAVAQSTTTQAKYGFEPVGTLAPHEIRMVNILRKQVIGAKGSMKPADRVAQLEVGETEVFANYTLQGFGKSLRTMERDSGKEFNYTEATFSPGVGLPGQRLLWVQRKK